MEHVGRELDLIDEVSGVGVFGDVELQVFFTIELDGISGGAAVGVGDGRIGAECVLVIMLK